MNASDGGCNTNSTVTVTVNPNPVVTSIVATPNTLCAGESANLTAQSINASPGTAALGTATTTTSAAGITPFNSNWEGSRTQYLVRASELSAIGLTAGNLTSLAFDVTSAGAGTTPQSGFTIKIANTTQTTLNGASYGTPVGTFTTVYGPASVGAPAVGIRTLLLLLRLVGMEHLIY